jgi:Tfp pilus assembly protein PilF
LPGIGRELFICLFIIVATYCVYQQVGGHEFVTFDDGLYVTENLQVKNGLNLENIVWSFTTTHSSNWHPLTWMSHMLDVSLFGMNPGSHHLVNVFFHLANSLLLFRVFRKMTGDLWQSAFVAALFAIHPLHVESVAWVAERKDVLSTFFWMLTVWFYVGYVKDRTASRYIAALLFFFLGLMTKPMLVTLPFALLLFDYWPLGRLNFKKHLYPVSYPHKNISFFDLIIEKIPFFVFTAASSVVTVYAQRSGGSVASLEVFPLGVRIANAVVAYVSYIAKMFWPVNLNAFYPHSYSLPMWQVAATASLLPYLLVGWLFYLGTLFPVIGLIQVGEQAMADRYTYVPLIGIFIILAWGLTDLLKKWRYQKIGVVLGAALLLPALMVTTWLQVRHWSNNIEFYEHIIKVTDNNFMAHYNLGVFLADHDQVGEAIGHYRKALSIKPGHANANNNLANALMIKGKSGEAIQYYTNALKRAPDDPEIHNNFGVALLHTGKIEQAIHHFHTALKIRPNYIEARQNLQKAGRQ